MNNQSLDHAFLLIDQIITNDVSEGFPAAQLAVMKDGQLICDHCWGPVNRDTLFDLASNTKMYTVVYAVMHLVSERKLSLDTRIVDILGEHFATDTILIKYADGCMASLEQNIVWKRSLTVQDVLCHQAGFPADPAYHRRNYDFAAQKADPAVHNLLFSGWDGSETTREKTLQMICKTPLMFEPRTDVLYSDVDYMLMTFVIEKVTGQRLDEYMKRTFYAPLGLEHLTYAPLQNGFSAEDCAPTELHGNTRDGAVYFEGVRTGKVRGQVHDAKAFHCMGGISGHAGLFAAAHDLVRLADLMNDPSGISAAPHVSSDQVPFFDEYWVDVFTAPHANDHWGIGWWRQGHLARTYYFGTLCSEGTVGHQGWTGTLSVIDRAEKLAIVFLTNKISTPVTDPLRAPNMFDGNRFITSTLGFVTQLIFDGLRDIPFDKDLALLREKMQKQSIEDPCPASEAALRSIEKTCAWFAREFHQ